MKKTWQDLKCMPLRERSQSEKTAYCMILTVGFWKKAKLQKQKEEKSMLYRTQGREG